MDTAGDPIHQVVARVLRFKHGDHFIEYRWVDRELGVTPDTPGMDEASIETWDAYVACEYEEGGAPLSLAQAMARICRDKAGVSVDILLASRISAEIPKRLSRMIGFDVVSQGGSLLYQSVIYWFRMKQGLSPGESGTTAILHNVVSAYFSEKLNEWGLLSDINLAHALCEAAESLGEIDDMLDMTGLSCEREAWKVYQIEVDSYETEKAAGVV